MSGQVLVEQADAQWISGMQTHPKQDSEMMKFDIQASEVWSVGG